MSKFINCSQTYGEAILEAEGNIVNPLENTEGLTDKGLIRVLMIELNKALTEVRDTLLEHNKLLEVAENKTNKQCEAIKLFLDRNKKYIKNNPR